MTEPMKTAKDIMYKTFGVSSKLDMMKNQFIGLADQGKIVVAMNEYAAQQVAMERNKVLDDVEAIVGLYQCSVEFIHKIEALRK